MSRVNFDRNRDEDMGPIGPELGAERRFRLVVEAAPNAIVMVNRAGEIADIFERRRVL